LHRRALEVASILLQLRFEPSEQRERVGGRSRETGQDAIVVKPPDLARAVLDDGLAEGHLAVAGQNRAVAMPDGKYGGAVKRHESSDPIRPQSDRADKKTGRTCGGEGTFDRFSRGGPLK